MMLLRSQSIHITKGLPKRQSRRTRANHIERRFPVTEVDYIISKHMHMFSVGFFFQCLHCQ